MKKILVILLIVAAAIVVLPLTYNNTQSVEFNYLVGTYQLPLAWIVFGAFISGILVSLVFFAISGLGWKLKAKGLKKQVDELLKLRKRDDIAHQFAEEKAVQNTAKDSI